MTRTALILTARTDLPVDAVVTGLGEAGVGVVRADWDDLDITAEWRAPRWVGHVGNGVQSVALEEIGCVWWRKPSPLPSRFTGLSPDEWVRAERSAAVLGWLQAEEERIPWVNSPAVLQRAKAKPLQLAVADRAGLNVPATRLTAASRVPSDEGLVVKSIAGATVTDPASGAVLASFTAKASTLARPQGGADHPMIVQQLVRKRFDARVYVVGGQIRAYRVTHATEGAVLDWRIDPHHVVWEPVEIPAAVADSLRRFIDELHLGYAAVDFGVDHDNRWWFYEVNPNGQYWLAPQMGAEVAADLTALIAQRCASPQGLQPQISSSRHVTLEQATNGGAQMTNPQEQIDHALSLLEKLGVGQRGYLDQSMSAYVPITSRGGQVKDWLANKEDLPALIAQFEADLDKGIKEGIWPLYSLNEPMS